MPAKEYTYLLIDITCIAVPLLASFHPKSPFFKEWKYYLTANIVVSVLFLVWDALFTKAGIWGFNENYITGYHLMNLPLEEVLFFICIPYACTYTYYVFSKYTKVQFPGTAFRIGFLLSAALLVGVVLFPAKLYSSITFFSLSILLSILSLNKAQFFDRFLMVYLIILVPFFLSNGILTGTWVDKPIVWYNNDFNLGIRMFTIPVEDAFYAMLLLLLNITGYEWLKSCGEKSSTFFYK